MVTGGELVAAKFACSLISNYLGFVESTSKNIKLIMHMDFESAKKHLEDATTAENDEQRIFLLREAISKFSNAIQLVDNEEKIAALAGLSICNFLLKEKRLADSYLNQIHQVELSKSEIRKAKAKDAAAMGGKYLTPTIIRILTDTIFDRLRNHEKNRKIAFTTYKSKWVAKLGDMYSEKLLK